VCGFMNLNPQKAARTREKELGVASALVGAKPLVEVIKAKASVLVAAKGPTLKEAKRLW